MKVSKCDFVRLYVMPNDRDYCMAGVKNKCIIEELSDSEISVRIKALRRAERHAYIQRDSTIAALRKSIRKGIQQGYSPRDLDPYRIELAKELYAKFWFTHRRHYKDIIVWSIPIVPRKDDCGRLMEYTRDAAIRQLQELNTENGTNYEFV